MSVKQPNNWPSELLQNLAVFVVIILLNSSMLKADSEILIGQVRLLDEVLDESVGIETLGGVFTPLISKGDAVPTHQEMSFSTAEDNQPAIILKLYSGVKDFVNVNKKLAFVEITGFGAQPRGQPKVLVKISIDALGQVLVSAREYEKALDVKVIDQNPNETSK